MPGNTFGRLISVSGKQLRHGKLTHALVVDQDGNTFAEMVIVAFARWFLSVTEQYFFISHLKFSSTAKI